jgi:hypothetical protein
MKKSIIYVSLLLLASCGPSKDELTEKSNSLKASVGCVETDFKIVVIDSCEYLYAHSTTNAFVLTHKGNCKNHK